MEHLGEIIVFFNVVTEIVQVTIVQVSAIQFAWLVLYAIVNKRNVRRCDMINFFK